MKPFQLKIFGMCGWNTISNMIRSYQECVGALSREFHLDLSRITFCQPVGVVCLAAGVEHLKRKGYAMSGVTRPTDDNVNRYLERINLFTSLQEPDVLNLNRYAADGRFVELIHLTSAADCMGATSAVSRVIERRMRVDAVPLRAVDFILSELTENIFHHSLSSGGGYICCQVYPQLNVIRVAIVDLGIGIEAALQENPANSTLLQEVPPLTAAIQRKTTGRPAFNSGLGLFWSSKIVEINGGCLGLHSRTRQLIQEGSVINECKARSWPGTLVHLEFRTDQPLDHVAIFDQFTPADNNYDFLDE